jgi:hypothetical protein
MSWSSSSMREAARGTPSGGLIGAPPLAASVSLSGGGTGTLGVPPTPNCPEDISAALRGRPSGAIRMRCHCTAFSSSPTAAMSSLGSWHADMRVFHVTFCSGHDAESESVLRLDSSTSS